MIQNAFQRIEVVMNQPLAMWVRALIAVALAPAVFAISSRQVEKDSFLMPFWDRSYDEGTWDAFWGSGGSGDIVWTMPGTTAGIIAVVAVVFIAVRGLLYYPRSLSLNFLLFLIVDYLVVCGLVDMFIYGGSMSEIFLYGGAFIAGVVLFGVRVFSQVGLLLFAVLVLARLLYVDDLYPYMLLAPLLGLLYLVVRAPFQSEGFKESLDQVQSFFKATAAKGETL